MADPPEVSMEVDVVDFTKAAQRLIKANKKIAPGQIARSLLLEWLRKIILKWPVDTGRSRAGWAAMAKFTGLRLPSGGEAEAIAEGKRASGFEIKAEAGGRIVFTAINAVEYAAELEGGSSKQAPLGAVAISAREIELGRTPDDVIAAYQHLWDFLGKKGGTVEIRASDVKKALKKAGAPSA